MQGRPAQAPEGPAGSRAPLTHGPDQEGPGPRRPGEARLLGPVWPLPGRDTPSSGWPRPGVGRTWPRAPMGSRRPWFPPNTRAHTETQPPGAAQAQGRPRMRKVGRRSATQLWKSTSDEVCPLSLPGSACGHSSHVCLGLPPLPSGAPPPSSALLKERSGHRPPHGEAGWAGRQGALRSRNLTSASASTWGPITSEEETVGGGCEGRPCASGALLTARLAGAGGQAARQTPAPGASAAGLPQH